MAIWHALVSREDGSSGAKFDQNGKHLQIQDMDEAVNPNIQKKEPGDIQGRIIII